MTPIISLLILIAVLRSGRAAPVIESTDVGKVFQIGQNYLIINPGTFGQTVLLQIEREINSHICGGVIIKPDVVLTAAHCVVYKEKKPSVWAWAGIVHRELEIGKGQRIAVKDFRIHENLPEINSDGFYSRNDIAILWLEEPFNFNSKLVREAILPEGETDLSNCEGEVAGWGINKCGERTLMLQKATLKIMPQEVCQTKFKSKLSDSVFCAMSEDKMSANSPGDSGGPFIVDGVVVGLLSFGSTLTIRRPGGTEIKCDPTRPAGYTKLSSFVGWIEQQIKYGPATKNILDEDSKILSENTIWRK